MSFSIFGGLSADFKAKFAVFERGGGGHTALKDKIRWKTADFCCMVCVEGLCVTAERASSSAG
jgi:hypothetical protein